MDCCFHFGIAGYHILGYFLQGKHGFFHCWNTCLPELWVPNIIYLNGTESSLCQVNYKGSETKGRGRKYNCFKIRTSKPNIRDGRSVINK